MIEKGFPLKDAENEMKNLVLYKARPNYWRCLFKITSNYFQINYKIHFNNLFENGREVKLQIKVFKDWGKNLDTDFQNKALNEIIEEWLQTNTVKSKYNVATSTENLMNLEEVKIPVLDSKNRGVDARSFIRNLQNFLKEAPYSIPSKIISTGVGEATLILGDK